MARPWERPKARAKARARARARASNGLMCVKEGRPNVMFERKLREKNCCPRWDSNPQPSAFMADALPCATGTAGRARLLVQVPIPRTNSPL